MSLVFAGIGHIDSHRFVLLYATVVLALEGEFDRPFGEPLMPSLLGFIAFRIAVAALVAGALDQVD